MKEIKAPITIVETQTEMSCGGVSVHLAGNYDGHRAEFVYNLTAAELLDPALGEIVAHHKATGVNAIHATILASLDPAPLPPTDNDVHPAHERRIRTAVNDAEASEIANRTE